MPRSSKPIWGASASYEVSVTRAMRLAIAKLDIELELFRSQGDFDDVCWGAAAIAAWASQEVPEPRRRGSALMTLSTQLQSLIQSIDNLSASTAERIRAFVEAVIGERSWDDPANVAINLPTALFELVRVIRGSEDDSLRSIIDELQSTADLLVLLDDYAQSDLFDALTFPLDAASSDAESGNPDPLADFRVLIAAVDRAANEAAECLSQRGRREHPWLPWAVVLLCDQYRALTGNEVTHSLDEEGHHSRSPGGKFVVGVIQASGAKIAESSILTTIRRYVAKTNL